MTERIEPSPFQARLLAIPEGYNVFAGGGRGGGKTYGDLLLTLRHIETYARNARVLVVRRSFPGLRDFEAEARYLFTMAYGKALTYNGQDHLFRFANGATCQLDQFEGPQDFAKVQGKSFSLICIEEAGQYPDPAPLDLLRSSLRSKAGVPCRLILSANPGGPGHGWLYQRHVAGVTPWQPYVELKSGQTFVSAPSTLADNPYLGADYARQIEAATASDPELQKAWLHGDWNISKGAFFGAVFDTHRTVIAPWRAIPPDWETYIAGDHGSAAPAVFYLCARSPGAQGPDRRWYPPGCVVLVDEVAFVEKDTLNKGLGLTVPTMAEEVIETCKSWDMRPSGVMDDACFAQHGSQSGTLADEYRRAGLILHRARKGDRISGWEVMRRMLADAGKPDVPGLYVSERCAYWLATTPFLDRSPRRAEDLDTTGPDHAADACRYALIYEPPRVIVRRAIGF